MGATRLLFIAVFSASVLIGTGCGTFTHWKPNPKDLIGTYVPDDQTEEIIRPKRWAGAPPSQIVVRADGTFSIENVPKWDNAHDLSQLGELVARTGKWRLEKKQGMWVLSIEYFEGIRHFASINVRGQTAPYLLHVGIGDPDSFLGLVFQKARR